MQIACPQCSMQYDLDPRLLPPGGVSVQCTRCRFVFTATPSDLRAQAAPTPAPQPSSAPQPPAPGGASPRSAKLNSTLLFGQKPDEPLSPETTQPFGALPPRAEPPAAPAPPPARPGTTQLFGAHELSDIVARADAANAKQAQAPIALPPEPRAAPAPSAAPRGQRPSRKGSGGELPELMSRGALPGDPPPGATRNGGGLLLMGGLLVVVLVAAGAVALSAWRQRARELPPDALMAREEAAGLLRRDDVASREQAIHRLEPLITRYPDDVESRAGLALARSLELDDLLLDVQRLDAAEERVQRRIREVAEEKSLPDWTSTLNALNQELKELQSQRGPLAQRLQVLLNETDALQTALRKVPEDEEPESAVVARLRAQAVHAGVRATNDAIELSERLRASEVAPHQWAAVARAAYALNANSPPASLAEVASTLESLREKDRTFLRAYVLGARIALKQGDTATAQALLDAVLALNPNHTLARKLSEWGAATHSDAARLP
ncbi:zinc-ribbon domain-containing protein [Myxococcaceae bacterium GXIMD 01537]